jgi:hypothetical protein
MELVTTIIISFLKPILLHGCPTMVASCPHNQLCPESEVSSWHEGTPRTRSNTGFLRLYDKELEFFS